MRSSARALHNGHSVTVQARRSLVILVVVLAAACVGDEDGAVADGSSTTTTAKQTWDCIVAMQITGFTTGTPVSEARIVLARLSDDPDLPQSERDYFADLAAALHDLPDSATVGTSLDDVECPLG